MHILIELLNGLIDVIGDDETHAELSLQVQKTVRGEPVEPRFFTDECPSTGSGRTDGAKVLP